jgi:hypothetical protein
MLRNYSHLKKKINDRFFFKYNVRIEPRDLDIVRLKAFEKWFINSILHYIKHLGNPRCCGGLPSSLSGGYPVPNEGVQTAFYGGDKRKAKFDIEVSTYGNNWKQVFGGESSGTTSQMELILFNEIAAKYAFGS